MRVQDATSPSHRPPLVGSAALQSIVRDDVSSVLGYSIPPRRHRFRFALAVFQPSPFADNFRFRLILSCALLSLQSLSSPRRPGANVRAPSLGFLPSSRHRPAESTFASLPRLASFRPRRFSRPRRLTPPPTFAGLFHPAATSRVHSSGSFPRQKPYELVARRCPHVVRPSLLPVFKVGSRTTRPPTGPCSSSEFVAARSGLGHALLDTLLSFRFPRVFLLAPCKRPSSPAPTTAFHGPRRITRARPDLLLRACLPRPKFPA
jgi:hypothetical protein